MKQHPPILQHSFNSNMVYFHDYKQRAHATLASFSEMRKSDYWNRAETNYKLMSSSSLNEDGVLAQNAACALTIMTGYAPPQPHCVRISAEILLYTYAIYKKKTRTLSVLSSKCTSN